jgi:hypothetical protein
MRDTIKDAEESYMISEDILNERWFQPPWIIQVQAEKSICSEGHSGIGQSRHLNLIGVSS